MIRNLGGMIKDEDGCFFGYACFMELLSCVSFPTWICCIPCLLGPIIVPIGLMLDGVFCPGEAGICGLMGILPLLARILPNMLSKTLEGLKQYLG